ncbi:TRAP transporter large permease [Halomonas salipaludis]|uniref:TRAP transporter large permease protein n=1 Tax=Halomonas salipaludis TaxID=2032625 RepID=A0A2A2EP38_9GAMM|nr:TRAP transporter large permease [Halomonas salipaludis]PAU74053.1 C4-dicarboxylate ABC transporter permease [Halomonas salipaludis]
MIEIAIGIFVLLALLGMPLAFAIGVASLAGLWYGDMSLSILPERMLYAVDSFPLMAIPFFILAGELMVVGGAMARIISLANSLIGRVRGGLAHVTILSSMGLSAVSGTAIATASALGSTLVPSLSEAYDKKFAAGLVIASANLGPIIPPSAGMIVYAIMAGPSVSVSALFLSGVLPGILLAFILMCYVSWVAWRRGYPFTGEPISLKRILRELRRGLIIVLMPIIVVGGIISGAFTATEGSAIAVLYALFIGFAVTRELKIKDIPGVLLRAAITTSIVGALIAFASTITFLFTIELIPQALSEWLRAVTDNKYLMLVIVMIILACVGMFIEANAAFIMLVPLFAPLAIEYGLDPLHFALLFVLNIVIGSITPPIGVLLFVMSGITRLSIGKIVSAVWPYVIIQFGFLSICMFWPALVLTLPRLFGF